MNFLINREWPLDIAAQRLNVLGFRQRLSARRALLCLFVYVSSRFLENGNIEVQMGTKLRSADMVERILSDPNKQAQLAKAPAETISAAVNEAKGIVPE